MKIIIDTTSPRKRKRIVDRDSVIDRASELAEENLFGICVRNGGGVVNSYGYATTTQVAGAVAIKHRDQIHVWCKVTEIPANKVTQSGSCAATIGWRLFDGRVSADRKKAYKSRILCEAAAKLALWE